MDHKLYLIILLIACFNTFAFGNLDSDKEKFQDYKIISNIIDQGIDLVLDDKIEEGHVMFKKALKLAGEKDYKELIPIIIISQSRLYALEDRHQEGLNALLSIKKFYTDNPDGPYAGDYYEYLGHTYLKLGNLSLALDAFKITENIRNKTEPAKNWRTYNGLADIYQQLNNPKLAEEYAVKSKRLAKMQNSKKILADIRNDMAFNEKDGTIAILSSENISTKFALYHLRNKNFIYGIGIFALALTVAFLYIVLMQRNKLNKEITLKNEIISKSLEEKDYLIKEIHHRVKNNLQVISSLLSLQSRTVEDPNAVEALNESQSRVLSMSLIHQNLYKENHQSQVNLNTYLTNLCRNLLATYHINNDKVNLQMDIDDLSIDVGSMVPLGLIVNELFTNSLKYAFPYGKNGTIGISCKQDQNKLALKVWDNGVGQTPMENPEGFGYRLIQAFAKRLNALISKSTDNGTCIELVIEDIIKVV